MRRATLALISVMTLLAGAAQAAGMAALCDQAAHRAARMSGVPLDILLAITRAETGRDHGQGVQPWPWTLNQGGDGDWFDTPAEAMARAKEILETGEDNLDIGCFQLNVRWHGEGFVSLAEMFDPDRNALYAAGFLGDLYRESGSWTQAVQDYHSRTPEFAERYLARINGLLDGNLSPIEEPALAAVAALRVNNFPLLQAGEAGTAGSIVPRTGSRGALFGASF